MDKKYTKLSDLVSDQFTVEKAWGYQYKKWDNDSKRMLTSEKYEQGFSKVYSLDTDKGKLDVRAGQMGNLLEGVVRDGKADITGRTFTVKSNGKEGIDIRYFINPVRDSVVTETGKNSEAWKSAREKLKPDEVAEVPDEAFDMSQIPF